MQAVQALEQVEEVVTAGLVKQLVVQVRGCVPVRNGHL